MNNSEEDSSKKGIGDNTKKRLRELIEDLQINEDDQSAEELAEAVMEQHFDDEGYLKIPEDETIAEEKLDNEKEEEIHRSSTTTRQIKELWEKLREEMLKDNETEEEASKKVEEPLQEEKPQLDEKAEKENSASSKIELSQIEKKQLEMLRKARGK